MGFTKIQQNWCNREKKQRQFTQTKARCIWTSLFGMYDDLQGKNSYIFDTLLLSTRVQLWTYTTKRDEERYYKQADHYFISDFSIVDTFWWHLDGKVSKLGVILTPKFSDWKEADYTRVYSSTISILQNKLLLSVVCLQVSRTNCVYNNWLKVMFYFFLRLYSFIYFWNFFSYGRQHNGETPILSQIGR